MAVLVVISKCGISGDKVSAVLTEPNSNDPKELLVQVELEQENTYS